MQSKIACPFCVLSQPPTMLWEAAVLSAGDTGESSFNMEAKIYVGNLARSTNQADLNNLFTQAGQVVSVDVIKDRKSGEPKGYAFITMSAQSEADKAISMFNAYSLGDLALTVNLAKPREQRGFDTKN
jgi:RNA recognition motif-containing protein